jgi:polar amino acid transport system substrate-binding protein
MGAVLYETSSDGAGDALYVREPQIARSGGSPMFRSRSVHQHLLCTVGALAMAAVAVAGCSSSAAKPVSPQAKQLGTIKRGVVKVAIEAYAPYTSMQGRKMVGLDADILNAAAGKLGLKVEPVVTDFAGMLASVQTHRVDVTIGGVAWSADRQKQGLFTDPPYYSPPAMAVKSGKTYQSVQQLTGRQLGTVEGYVWVKSIQAVPHARLHAYPDAPSVFNDLASGRIDVGFLDPLLIIAAQKAQPGLKIATEYLTPPTSAEVSQHPAYTYFQPYMTGFYLPKEEPKLEAALSEQIRAMYADGELTTLIKKYGGDPNQFLKPSAEMAKQRQGVDRPSSWQPPST